MMKKYETDELLPRPRKPSGALLGAALSGLLGVGGACGDSHDHDHDPDPDQRPDAASNAVDAGVPDATTTPDANESKIISETEGTRTFADLKAECDTRGGYIQIHAACSGVNTCAGFSYGDWDPGLTTEHSCAGVNGCNGLSCVVLPEDGGKTATQILEEQLPETGPRPCSNCHAVWDETGPDFSKFKIYVHPGSGRTIDNWLDRTAEEQARIIAFGATGRFPDGTAYAHMSAYYQIYSRAEIERVVDYIRTEAEVVIQTVKVADPE